MKIIPPCDVLHITMCCFACIDVAAQIQSLQLPFSSFKHKGNRPRCAREGKHKEGRLPPLHLAWACCQAGYEPKALLALVGLWRFTDEELRRKSSTKELKR